jgi:N-dimethylarginine dimethylaminohydrolase
MRARYYELFPLRHIFQRYLRNGSSWLSAPRPRLSDDLYQTGEDGLVRLGETEPVFEAANVIRCGRDVFYQVSSSGNEAGLRWFQSLLRLLGDYRVHPLRGIYDHTHIDSTIALLRPGLALLNPERVSEATVPEMLRRWDVIWCPPMVDGGASTTAPLSSPWVGMNLLMVDTDLAIVDATQVPLIRCLESRGITVIPLLLRHARALGGGFHCVSLDTVRDGSLEDYRG